MPFLGGGWITVGTSGCAMEGGRVLRFELEMRSLGTHSTARGPFTVNIMNGVGRAGSPHPSSESCWSWAERASSEGRQPGTRYNLHG